jgi:hypothetical protein
METYLGYWKRGWWAWLMMLCINLGIVVVVLPLAAIFHGNKAAYWISALVAWLLVGAPFAGWVFERFAAGSKRINTPDHDVTPAV